MSEFASPCLASASAFDKLAKSYDEVFTESPVGKAQREAVWKCAHKVFASGIRLLELNCGTGEDALHFARLGIDVTACDISVEMLTRAREKVQTEQLNALLRFHVCAIENMVEIPHDLPFEGIFSNFSGLNCVEDLRAVADQMAQLVMPSSTVLLCFSTRFCVWETAWYIMRGKFRRAFRRWSGYHLTRLGGVSIPIYYPSLKRIRKCFAPHFEFISVQGIGITVPPSYVQPWMRRHPRLLEAFQQIDTRIRNWPGFRVLGDHMLVRFERGAA